MHELTIQSEFCAAHAIVIGGVREPVHGHNFRVVVALGASELDSEGLAVDFHAAETALLGILQPWTNRNLNEVDPFDRLNPTAELIAKVIADRLDERLRKQGTIDGKRVWVASAQVTEAPGCAAKYTLRR